MLKETYGLAKTAVLTLHASLKAKKAYNELCESTFHGARKNRLLDFDDNDLSGDAELLEDGTLEILRSRSREVCRNSPIAGSLIQKYSDNVVGAGLKPIPTISHKKLRITPDQAEDIAEAFKDVFSAWAKEADYQARMTFWEMQKLILEQRLITGEQMSIPKAIDARPGLNRITRRVLVIEADRLMTPTDMKDGEFLRGGVILGKRKQPVAYMISKKHPNDGFDTYNSLSSSEFTKVRKYSKQGALQFIHRYKQSRPDVSRGLPVFTPMIKKIHTLDRMSDAEQVAMRLASCIGLIIQAPGQGMAADLMNKNKNGKALRRMEPGMIIEGEPGQTVSPFVPQRGTDNFAQMVKLTQQEIAMGGGVSYGMITMDHEKSNFSNTRAEIIGDRRTFLIDRNFEIAGFSQPYYEMVMIEAFLRGYFTKVLPRSFSFEEFRSMMLGAEWVSTPGWSWIDPKSDAVATEKAIDMGVESPTRVAAERGYPIEKVISDKASIKRLKEEHGLVEDEEKPKNKTEEEPEDSEDEDANSESD